MAAPSYVVEISRDNQQLLWGPFTSASEAAEWAFANLPGPSDWVLRPITVPFERRVKDG